VICLTCGLKRIKHLPKWKGRGNEIKLRGIRGSN
jgi:hypothetical protein